MANEPIIYGPQGLTLQDGGTVERPEWSIDVVTARFRCRTSRVYQLIPKWGAGHPNWGALKKVSHRITEEKGGWSGLDVTYRGSIDGTLPPLKEEPGISLDTVQLSTAATLSGDIGDLGASSMEYEYYSPYTEFNYWSFTLPTGPRYSNRLLYIEDAFTIEKRNPPGGASPFLIGGESYLAATVRGNGEEDDSDNAFRAVPIRNGAFNGVINLVTSGFKVTAVCQGIWQVAETTAARIQPYGLSGRIQLMG